MTNKELVLKQLGEDTETLADILVSDCELCKSFGTGQYCNSKETHHLTCKETIEKWLNMEHTEPLLFPIGTPVEVNDGIDVHMGYYNGFEHDVHYVVNNKRFIGSRYRDGELYGVRCKAEQLKKVGES